MTPSGVAAHPQQSLPSFAQAFSPSSLGQISQGSRISLPPIQTQPLSRLASPANVSYSSSQQNENKSTAMTNMSRKRVRTEENNSDSETHSPRTTRVKEEPEQSILEPSSQPPAQPSSKGPILEDTSGAPPPSSVHPLKRRRVTVSGPPQPGALNTDVRPPADQANSTPISPVVVGFTIQRDNPNAVEQVRSMISVKQQQKALIEQRRGSVAGLISPPNINTGAPSSQVGSTLPPPPIAVGPSGSRSVRRSPNPGASRRHTNPHPSSPIPHSHSQTGPSNTGLSTNSHSLPPPPISFARRRANQTSGKGKPADIVISPREAHTKEQLALSIQSAPPIPRADGQRGSFNSARMTLPRLPSALGTSENVKRVATGNVPPTPTRLSLLRDPSGTGQVSRPIPAIAGRSPPANVAIASTLVPPTPSSLHRPGYSGEKHSFLAPFEMFYDALNDSKQLKTWLGDQLAKSQALMQNLNQQHEQLHDIVETLVERKVGPMRAEMNGMQRRIEQLESELMSTGLPTKVKAPLPRNGLIPPDTYTFPQGGPMDRDRFLSESDRRISSPGGWNGHHLESREPMAGPSGRDSENSSPAPFASRRLSVSATRLETPKLRGEGSGSSGSGVRPPVGPGSSPTQFRDRDREGSHPPLPGKMVSRGKPSLNRHQSSPRMPGPPPPLLPGMSMRRSEEEHQRNLVMSSPPQPTTDRDR